MAILKLDNISFSYDGYKYVLEDISYEFGKGNIYSIVGKSGAGKTTLLSILSGLAEPTDGSIYYNDEDIKDLNKYEYRSKYVGVVFQSFNLITKFTARENVVLSMDIAGKKDANKKETAYKLLESVGLDRDEADRRVLKLSGGQQQRVAIARALAHDPDIILADEPTGNLDGETQQEIMDIFRELANQGKCIILVTHSPEVAEMSDCVYTLKKNKKDVKKKSKKKKEDVKREDINNEEKIIKEEKTVVNNNEEKVTKKEKTEVHGNEEKATKEETTEAYDNKEKTQKKR